MKKENETIVKIATPTQVTRYLVGCSLMENLHTLAIFKKDYSSFLIFIDATVNKLFGSKIIASLNQIGKKVIVVPVLPGEKIKNINNLSDLIAPFLRTGFNRNALILGIGGGVVTDIAGFVSSILLRGLDVVLLPTTLLSQVDAAIGGKNGMNFSLNTSITLKNMLGTFKQPNGVICDIDFLKTLPEREIQNGLGEMVKYSVGWNTPTLANLQQLKAIKTISDDALVGIIKTCQEIKISSIKNDPFEKTGLRDRLNLGHTVGHAIEGASFGTLTHGQAVAVGLCAIAKMSHKMNILDNSKAEQIIISIKKLGLPTTVKNIKMKDVLLAMKMDKKGGTFVLLTDIGKMQTRQEVPEKIIIEVLKEIIV